MSLSSYAPPRENVPAGPVTLSVRGLNINDVALLMAAHANGLIAGYRAFEQMTEGSLDTNQAVNKIVLETVIRAPDLAADIIRLACDEPDAGPQARALPFPVQVTALAAIMRLTFEAGGGLGNFLAALDAIARGLGIELPKNLPQPSRPQSESGS